MTISVVPRNWRNARETTAALTNCGRAPITVAIFTWPLLPYAATFRELLKRRAASCFLRSEPLANNLRKRVKLDWTHMLTNGQGSSQAKCAVSCTPENEATHFRRVNLPRR